MLAPAAGSQLAEALDTALGLKSLPDPHQQLPTLLTRLRSPSSAGARVVDLSEGDICLILKHKDAFSNLGRAAQGALYRAEAALNERYSKKSNLVTSTRVAFPPRNSRGGID
jgi:hypothetical protein